MADMNIHGFRLVDRSTVVARSDLEAMVPVLRIQASDAAARWQIRPVIGVNVGDPLKPAAANVMDIVILDDADQANALGYHDVGPDGKPYARVFARPVVDHGGGVLTVGTAGVSVASVVSHELLEALVDPYANDWVSRPDGRTMVAQELCDPVQAHTYDVWGVALSDWLTPNWFIDGAPGPYDRMGVCTRPFQVVRGGYQILADAGGYRSVHDDTSPEWRRAARRHPAARTERRIATRAGIPRPRANHDSGVWEARKKSFLDRVLDFLYRGLDAP